MNEGEVMAGMGICAIAGYLLLGVFEVQPFWWTVFTGVFSIATIPLGGVSIGGWAMTAISVALWIALA